MDFFNNVKFSVLTSQYDEDLRTRVLKPDPIISNVPGHLVDANSGLERTGSKGSEVDRSPRYRMNVKLSDAQLEKIASGATLLITHKKHLDIAKWLLLPIDKQQQYIVQMDADSGANSRYIALSLTRKDQV